MGADLIYSMCYMEVSENDAKRRKSELTFEKLTKTDQKGNFLLRTHEDKIADLFWKIQQLPYEEADEDKQKEEIAHMKQQFVSDVMMDVAKAIDVVYGPGIVEDTQEMSQHSTSEETKDSSRQVCRGGILGKP